MSVVYTCDCGTYNFYIVDSPTTTEVTPLNFLETALVDELESNQIFYRRKFQGTLLFGGRGNKADFDYFWAIEQATPCKRLTFLIYKESILLWEGYFSTSSGHWDLDACTFEVTPMVVDDYVDLLDGGDIQYNILYPDAIAPVTVYYNTDGGATPAANTYTRCRMLVDVIEYIASLVVGSAVTVDSTFFEDANNPVTLTTNHYNYLTIAQKSDIKRPESTNPATVGMISFNELMNMLRCMNLYWDFDGSVLLIEHVSFWPHPDGLDIRTQKITRGSNKYNYLKESMPKYEVFSWMEAGNNDFIGEAIWYDSDCVNQDTSSNISKYSINVTTDLDYIRDCMSDPDSESFITDEGWVILATENRTGDLYVYITMSIYFPYQIFLPNMDMAWTYLHRLFFMHDRQLITGYLNGSLVTFYTARKVKIQECSIVTCEDLIPDEYMTTELGETYFGGEKAKVGKAVIKPYGEVNLQLLYGPADNAIVAWDYENILFLWETLKTGAPNEESTFHAMVNHLSGADVEYIFTVDIYDTHDHQCTSANLTITVLAGSYTGSVDYVWCKTMTTPTAPYCIDEIHTVSITPGWVDVDLNENLESLCT